jgi:hypothetical protein
LSIQNQIDAANTPENFMWLGKSTNATKGAKTIREWNGHSKLEPIPDKIKNNYFKKIK